MQLATVVVGGAVARALAVLNNLRDWGRQILASQYPNAFKDIHLVTGSAAVPECSTSCTRSRPTLHGTPLTAHMVAT